MDQTGLFVAVVKTVKLRIKAQRRESGATDSAALLLAKSSSRRLTPFAAEAKDVVSYVLLHLSRVCP